MTRFFHEIEINVAQDGFTSNNWSQEIVSKLNGTELQKVILRLVSPKLYGGNRENIKLNPSGSINSKNEY